MTHVFVVFLTEGGPERYFLGVWSSVELIAGNFKNLKYGYDHNSDARLVSDIGKGEDDEDDGQADNDECYAISVIKVPIDTLHTVNIYDGYDHGAIFCGSINGFKAFLTGVVRATAMRIINTADDDDE